jgi:hypothetical protein
MAILPSRPLLLDQAYLGRFTRRTWFSFALMLLLGVGCSFGSFIYTRECLEERALWAAGTPGRVRSISGEVEETGRLGVTLIYGYKLDVEYVDAQGDPHRGRSEFDLVWSPLRGDVTKADLRYDPMQPDRFVLSSPIEAGLPRWGMPLLTTALGLLMAFGLYENRRSHSRTLRGFTMAAEDGEEILAPLLSLQNVKGTFHIVFRMPGLERPVKCAIDKAPLRVTRDRTPHVVVLRSPREPEAFAIVRETLEPFAFDPETKARLLAQALGQRSQ